MNIYELRFLGGSCATINGYRIALLLLEWKILYGDKKNLPVLAI